MRKGVQAPTGNAGEKARKKGLPLLLWSGFMCDLTCDTVQREQQRACVLPHHHRAGLRAL